MVFRQLVVGLSVVLALSGCATAGSNTVYLYDGRSKMASWINEVVVWKDAQSVTREVAWNLDAKKVRCLARAGLKATEISRSGNVVKVRGLGTCTGFVHAMFVHSAKYGK